jgi:feruloyl esterase
MIIDRSASARRMTGWGSRRQPRITVMATFLVVAIAGPARAAVECEAIPVSLGLPGATVTISELVPSGAFQPQGGRAGGRGGGAFTSLPAFCRVAATLKPTPRSDIRMEVWLPASGWNGKLQVAGNGGFAGTIGYAAMARVVAAGYAAASTDTGHTGPSSNTFANEDVLIDFAYRAVHETTAAAKRIVDRFYGEAPRFSYFAGCSTGGRQALTAAQRYPDDFDGIVAGAPALHTSLQAFGQIWMSRALADPAAALPRESLTLLHDAVLNACDAQDGARDGVLENPLACSFDPGVLACGAGREAGSCLTGPQVEAARKIYAGASHARTGEPVFPGLERGSELGWSPTPVGYAVDYFKYRVFNDPDWEPGRLDFDAHLTEVAKPANQVLDAADPDLDRFRTRGGKLLMYQGWAEPGIPPRRLVEYYDDVQRQTADAADAIRLFMVPGMGHCGGGDGASTFDMVAALDRWVTTDTAPASIPASRVRGGSVDRTRPLCAYPAHAVYTGSGSLDDAASFECRNP